MSTTVWPEGIKSDAAEILNTANSVSSNSRPASSTLCPAPGRRRCWSELGHTPAERLRYKRAIRTWAPGRRAREPGSPMVDHPTILDVHRGTAAQKATDLRRLRSEVEADQAALRVRQAELEDLLAAAPATNWPEAVEKARYLLGLFAQSTAATDPRRRKLIDRVMADFDHLLGSETSGD